MIRSSPSLLCSKTAPSPCFEASVLRRNGSLKQACLPARSVGPVAVSLQCCSQFHSSSSNRMDAYGGNSHVGQLRRALVVAPNECGWLVAEDGGSPKCARAVPELGYLHHPLQEKACAEHEKLCAALEEAGVELLRLPQGPQAGAVGQQQLSLDAIYAHDASIVCDAGAVLLRMGKQARAAEPAAHKAFYAACGVPILGAVTHGTVEAGDLVFVRSDLLLAGRSYRSSAEGIAHLADLLAPVGVQVISTPIPHGAGPTECMHLMSIMSMLDSTTVLVDRSLLAVETVQLLQDVVGLRLLDIDESERQTLACNVLALGGPQRKLLALAENPRTNARLRAAGFEVVEFPGSEVGINGGGGPTCLTRPVLRAQSPTC